MEMAKKANDRLDLMDSRCDKMEDDIKDLREYVLRKEKEMEEMQLEQQIEQIRQELAEAKQVRKQEEEELRRFFTVTYSSCVRSSFVFAFFFLFSLIFFFCFSFFSFAGFAYRACLPRL